MQNLNKLHLLLLLFLHISKSHEIQYCGNTVIQEPFIAQNPTNSSILNHMILCKSGKLYLRTTIGLFPVSSVDYSAKLLTVSHTDCSSTSNFISPHHLSAGLIPSPHPSSNSIILLNCSKKVQRIPSSSCDDNIKTFDHGCGDLSVKGGSFPCLAIDDFESLGGSFDPYKEMDCTHYRRVYRNGERLEMGTQIGFGIPDHVPNPCDQCEKPDGNCGVGLRCVCHPKKCKDKVISVGAVLINPFGNIFFSMFFFILAMETL